MARSKSWTESQQPENQYTYGQYVFNVVAMLLIAMGLAALLIYVLWPAPQSTIQVVAVRSDVGELRTIPFQESDFAGLSAAFAPNAITHFSPFNEKQSFDLQVIDRLKKLEESTTLVVVCSAIGDLQGSEPILKPTGGGDPISVKAFLKACANQTKAERRIIVLDCGHDYAHPETYFDDETQFNAGNDFNRFVDAVGELVETGEISDQSFAVITSTSVGEIPLYSYNQRRTLFSLALQNTMSQQHETVEEFHQSLVNYCHDYGGEAAQTPRLFQAGTDASPFPIASLKLLPVSEDKEDEEEEVEAPPIQHLKTTAELEKIVACWRDRDVINAQFANQQLLTPQAFDTRRWDAAIQEITEKTWAIRNDKDVGPAREVRNFRSQTSESKKITQKYPGLFPPLDTPPEQLSALQLEVRDIAKAFRSYHRSTLHAKYHAAIFDSLSWLDQSDSLEEYRVSLENLNARLLEHSQLFADSNANQSDLEAYATALDQITANDQEAQISLRYLCEYLHSLHGFTRELAIISLLDSPLTPTGPSEPEAVAKNYERLGLLKALATPGDDSPVLISGEVRKKNSKRRAELYQQVFAISQASDGNQLELNRTELQRQSRFRKQDPIAYSIPVGESWLPSLSFIARPTVFNVTVVNKDKLARNAQIIEQDPLRTTIDLGLTANTANGNANLICKLVPANAPFKFHSTDSGKLQIEDDTIRIMDSNGRLELYSTAVADASNANARYYLSVQIDNRYQAQTFQMNDLKKPLLIPLSLPFQDRVGLEITVGGELTQPVQGTHDLLLSPWPNRPLPVKFSLTNYLHKDRTLRATIYPCISIPRQEIMPGNIDQAIKTATLERLNRSPATLPAIIRSSLVAVSPGTATGPSAAVALQWPVPTEPDPNFKLAAADTPFPQGLLCRVESVSESGTSQKTWDFWLPVFPNTENCLATRIVVDTENDSIELAYTKHAFFKNTPITIGCWLDQENELKSANLLNDTGKIKLMRLSDYQRKDEAARKRNRELFQDNSATGIAFLHIDIDGWPRRLTYVYDGVGQFMDAKNRAKNFPNAEFIVDSGDSQTDPPTGPQLSNVNPEGKSIRRALGYTDKKLEQLSGTLQINCDFNQHFRFPDSTDHLQIQYGNIEQAKYFFPRQITSRLATDPNSSNSLRLTSSVTDYKINRKITSSTFDIDPQAFKFAGQTIGLSGRDVSRIMFDDTPPRIPNVELDRREVFAKEAVRFKVIPIMDVGGGVGVARNPLAAVSASLVNLLDQKKKAIELKLDDDGFLFFNVMEPGSYELRTTVNDQLGNISEETRNTFKAVEKPKPVEPKEDDAQAPKVKPPSKPVTDVLLVRVTIGSQRLTADQKPDLQIEPKTPGLSVKRINADTFRFTGLEKGQEYTVTGNYKMKSGFRLETQGSVSHPFATAEQKPFAVTKTKNLTLEAK